MAERLEIRGLGTAALALRGRPFEPIQYGFPGGRAGRYVDRDPAVIPGVRLVKSVVERGCVTGSRLRHPVNRYLGAAGRMVVLEVDSCSLFGQFPVRR